MRNPGMRAWPKLSKLSYRSMALGTPSLRASHVAKMMHGMSEAPTKTSGAKFLTVRSNRNGT